MSAKAALIDVDIRMTLRGPGRPFTLQARFDANRERLVLFGPSGCGKTLTLQAMAGLRRPDEGHIRLGGQVLFDSARGIDVPARDRQVAYVFQDYALFPHLNVARNIAFGLMPLWRWRMSAPIARQVDAIMQALGIGELADLMPSALSGGQRQRVALARALIRQPRLLLLDEPFSALDIALRDQVRSELAEIRQRFGVPMVLISHDLDDVRQFADTVVLYEPGRVAGLAHRQADGNEGNDGAADMLAAARVCLSSAQALQPLKARSTTAG